MCYCQARYYVWLRALVKGTRFKFVHQVYSLFVDVDRLDLVIRGIELSHDLAVCVDIFGYKRRRTWRCKSLL